MGTKLREEFAKICFEVLLQFSLLHEEQNEIAKSTSQITNQLAITSLLDRFHNVLSAFAQDGKNNGKCPLPRLIFLLTGYCFAFQCPLSIDRTGTRAKKFQLLMSTRKKKMKKKILFDPSFSWNISDRCRYRVAEVSFTLQGLTSLISALKKIPTTKGKSSLLQNWLMSISNLKLRSTDFYDFLSEPSHLEAVDWTVPPLGGADCIRFNTHRAYATWRLTAICRFTPPPWCHYQWNINSTTRDDIHT